MPSKIMPVRITLTMSTRRVEKASLIMSTEISIANKTLVSLKTATGAMRSWLNAQTMIAQPVVEKRETRRPVFHTVFIVLKNTVRGLLVNAIRGTRKPSRKNIHTMKLRLLPDRRTPIPSTREYVVIHNPVNRE